MSLKHLLGLDDMNITDTEIMERIKTALDHELHEVEFVRSNGTAVLLRLPQIDFIHQMDPWDGFTGQKN